MDAASETIARIGPVVVTCAPATSRPQPVQRKRNSCRRTCASVVMQRAKYRGLTAPETRAFVSQTYTNVEKGSAAETHHCDSAVEFGPVGMICAG